MGTKRVPYTKKELARLRTLHRMLWNWRIQNPFYYNGLWPGWDTYPHQLHHCFACEVTLQSAKFYATVPTLDLSIKICKKYCPLVKQINVCGTSRGNIYDKLHNAVHVANIQTAVKYATIIRDAWNNG